MTSLSEVPPIAHRSQRWLAGLLRGLGLIDLAALVPVFLPMPSIAWVHQWMGLEPLPDGRIVEYLVRTTPALYALHGALLLYVSFDVVRYRPVIRLLGWLMAAHGAVLVFIDFHAGMPLWWTWCEGPIFAVSGLALVVLSKR